MGRTLLDCYWVGSLDFSFWEIKGFCSLNPQKVKLFTGGSTATKSHFFLWVSPVQPLTWFLRCYAECLSNHLDGQPIYFSESPQGAPHPVAC